MGWSTNVQACHRCPKRTRHDAAEPFVCTANARRFEENIREGRCPAGRFGLPIANLDGYDPETDPQSPKHGSCCDPPRG